MPSKKKKKKKKKQPKPQEVEFDLNFTDVTMLEADGDYERVKYLIEVDPDKDGYPRGPGPHNWTLSSYLTIESPFGLGRLELDFKADRSVYIRDYQCSGNPATTPDLSALLRWSQISGWKIPQPIPDLIKTNISFWRYMWETLIIDSDYLDKRFGVRKSLDMREAPKTEMELAEETEEFEAVSDQVKAQRKAEWKHALGLEAVPEKSKKKQEETE